MTQAPKKLRKTSFNWFVQGGIAADGAPYSSPSDAIAWGRQGCSLLPKAVREQQFGKNVPLTITRIFGRRQITVGELDSKLLHQCDMWELNQQQKSNFNKYIRSLYVPNNMIAIPAGIPREWLRALPLTARTRNAVVEAFVNRGSNDCLMEPLLTREFFKLLNVGRMSLIDLVCVIESARIDSSNQSNATSSYELINEKTVTPSLKLVDIKNEAEFEENRELYSFIGKMQQFAAWALTETKSKNFGDALKEIGGQRTDTQLWADFNSINLRDLSQEIPHPYEILDGWANSLDESWRMVLWERISVERPSISLQEIASQFNITRERIRQIEIKIRRDLQEFLRSDSAISIRWRAETLKHILGVACPAELVYDELLASEHCRDYRWIILELAGPYACDENGWYVLKSAMEGDPMSSIIAQADEVGRINREQARQRLNEWGLDEALHHDWLKRTGEIKTINDQMVCPGRSVGDRLAFALTDLARAASIEDMMSHIDEKKSIYTAKNALSADSRFIKVSLTHWALATWENVEYQGIANSIRALLEKSDGRMLIVDVVQHMHEVYGISEQSTRIGCQVPLFVAEGKEVRLRSEDEPFQLDVKDIDKARGVFHLASTRVGILINVDENILRGSGFAMYPAAGAILDINVNSKLKFIARTGEMISITFPETAHARRPSFGSIRKIAEKLSAKKGDMITLVLDRSDLSLSFSMTTPDSLSRSWELVAKITGIETPVDLDKLAGAIHCKVGEVRSRLKKRGDIEVLSVLPEAKASPILDEAL